MNNDSETLDFRLASHSKSLPKAVVDGVAGMLLAAANLPAPPERVFRALLTREVERWWRLPDVYALSDWEINLRPQGRWSVTVALTDGRTFNEWGEICAVEAPHSIVMTRRFAANPLLAERETTLTYRLEPTEFGTRLTLKEEGFVGRSEAAYGNAENWEKVIGWLQTYLSSEVTKP